MSEHTKAFIDNLANGQNADAGEAFKDALRDKVATSLDQARSQAERRRRRTTARTDNVRGR